MKPIGVLYKYELKKIVRRKIVYISLVVSVVLILFTTGGTMLDFLYEKDGETETMYQAFLTDKSYEKALEGRTIDQALLEETLDAYGKVPDGEGYYYSTTEEYQTYARPYSAIFQFIRVITNMTVTEVRQWKADEGELYARWLACREQEADSFALSQGEKEFWREQADKMEWPLEYRYKEGYWRMHDCLYTIGLLAIVASAICLSGVFVEEHNRKTDQLILSSRHGRQTLFWAKFLAGMAFALALSLIFTAVTFLAAFAIYGAEGFTADFRLVQMGFAPSINVGEAVLICYGCMTAAVCVTSAFVLMLSELIRSSIGTLSLVMGSVILSIFVHVPEHLRVLSQVWSYFPGEFIAPWNIFNPRLVKLFGSYFMPWQVVPLFYLLFGTTFALLGRSAFVRYQVKGR